jgi:putative ABC transport system ATP-binding protein
MGPSGSGKSTLMNILGCLDQPTSGEYWLDGIEVGRLGDDDLARIRNRHIGFIFQGFNLLPRLTAAEQVELALAYGGVSHQRGARARAALQAVGLADRLHHRPNQLSGGQQQRVAIARALVNRPRVILADEPTGSLDTKSSTEIITLLRELNVREGVAVVLITHEPEIASYTNRIVHIRDGAIENDQPNVPSTRDTERAVALERGTGSCLYCSHYP